MKNHGKTHCSSSRWLTLFSIFANLYLIAWQEVAAYPSALLSKQIPRCHLAFVGRSRSVQPTRWIPFDPSTKQRTCFFVSCGAKKVDDDACNDADHITHGLSEISEETGVEILESENAAVWDAHDCPDAGVEAAAEERAVMLAAEMMHSRIDNSNQNDDENDEPKPNPYDAVHLAHGLSEVQEEMDKELKKSVKAAAWDAHDCPDAGVEAAAEERAVMLAAEMMHSRIENSNQNDDKKDESKAKSYDTVHLAHGLSEVHEETDKELAKSEKTAAWDAHDCPDAGMEAAAEERAVMLAAEMARGLKEKAISDQDPKKES